MITTTPFVRDIGLAKAVPGQTYTLVAPGYRGTIDVLGTGADNAAFAEKVLRGHLATGRLNL